VQKSRDRLELPTDKFPVIRFYDDEDFEMQNIEEMDNNQRVFIDTSGQDVPPPLKPEQRHVFPNPILAQQMGLPPPPPAGTPVAPQQQAQATPQAAAPMGGMPQATDAQFGSTNTAAPSGGGADRGTLLVSLPVQVLDNGKLRVEQVELYANDDAEDVARVFCINHRIGDPECAKLLEALKQRRQAATGQQGQATPGM
jgi:hypothetical protein